MPNTYEVELCFARTASDTAVLVKCVQAEDGYEAIALARQLVALQNPEVDGATIERWSVTRHGLHTP